MKTMSRESMDKVVNDHFMYEATDDIEGVLRTFTDDAEHEVVGGPAGPLRGKAALRRFYERLFPELKGECVEPVILLYESVWTGQVVDGRPFKLAGKRGKARLRILHVFRLRDVLISKENVWFD